MKINWGTGIAIFYSCFVAVLIFALIKSFSVDNSLVQDDYYSLDLAYQSHYTKRANALTYSIDVKRDIESEEVRFEYPEQLRSAEGTILFFRPADQSKDFKVAVKPGQDLLQVVSTQALDRGLWKIKIDWKADDAAYYTEEVVIL